MEKRKTLALTAGLLTLATLVAAQTERQGQVADAFAQRCAACHGAELQGGQAKSLLDDEWKYGGDDASLAASIRDGHPTDGMPPFAAMLDDQAVRAMVIFIRERADSARRSKTTFAKPLGDTVVTSEEHKFRLELVTEGLETPWSIAFLPDGRMLVTEKAGRLRIVDKGKLLPEPVAGVPKVWSEGQGGLLDVAPHPDYATNGWIYLSYTNAGADGSAMTRVMRGRLKDGALVDQQTLYDPPAELYRTGPNHFGSRFVFDGKGYLFFTIGERDRRDDAQDLTRPNGKVHRIFDDGRVPEDNPFVKAPGAYPTIWSYGHRNPQGLARNPVTGELYDAEHGPRGGDEINLVLPGKNYGWPVITYGMNYDGTPITNLTAKEGMEQPVTYWTPSIAVCAIDFYVGDRFPRWKNDLLVSSLAAEELRRLRIDGGKLVKQEVLFKGIGRLRDVVVGPDGLVYVAFNVPDRIARLVPVP
ncbi:MAG: PQQ-dependent sugar dehydrogenase [Burkholderiales bacterium]